MAEAKEEKLDRRMFGKGIIFPHDIKKAFNRSGQKPYFKRDTGVGPASQAWEEYIRRKWHFLKKYKITLYKDFKKSSYEIIKTKYAKRGKYYGDKVTDKVTKTQKMC